MFARLLINSIVPWMRCSTFSNSFTSSTYRSSSAISSMLVSSSSFTSTEDKCSSIALSPSSNRLTTLAFYHSQRSVSPRPASSRLVVMYNALRLLHRSVQTSLRMLQPTTGFKISLLYKRQHTPSRSWGAFPSGHVAQPMAAGLVTVARAARLLQVSGAPK